MNFYNTDFLRNDEIYLKLERTFPAVPEKDLADSYYFRIHLTSDGTMVGDCDLRIGYNKRLYYGGNISYTVYKPHRGNHYAGKACRLLFKLALKHGMDYLYITCNPDNIPSMRTCEYAGGILESTADLPEDNDMYLEGERQKCIYKFILNS